MTFKIIDKKTGKEPTDRVITNIAKKQGLIAIRIDQFAIMEDGQIILLDDCGKAAYLDMNRFEVRWDNGWIPCSERLPQKSEYGKVLVTYIPSGGTLWTTVIIAHYSDLMGIAKPCFHIGEVGKKDFQNITDSVTAWQPLPKPYRKDGE